MVIKHEIYNDILRNECIHIFLKFWSHEKAICCRILSVEKCVSNVVHGVIEEISIFKLRNKFGSVGGRSETSVVYIVYCRICTVVCTLTIEISRRSRFDKVKNFRKRRKYFSHLGLECFVHEMLRITSTYSLNPLCINILLLHVYINLLRPAWFTYCMFYANNSNGLLHLTNYAHIAVISYHNVRWHLQTIYARRLNGIRALSSIMCVNYQLFCNCCFTISINSLCTN